MLSARSAHFTSCPFRSACSISDTDSVLITGGVTGFASTPTSQVSRYNNQSLKDLPSLLTARSNHACAMYTTDRGTKV